MNGPLCSQEPRVGQPSIKTKIKSYRAVVRASATFPHEVRSAVSLAVKGEGRACGRRAFPPLAPNGLFRAFGASPTRSGPATRAHTPRVSRTDTWKETRLLPHQAKTEQKVLARGSGRPPGFGQRASRPCAVCQSLRTGEREEKGCGLRNAGRRTEEKPAFKALSSSGRFSPPSFPEDGIGQQPPCHKAPRPAKEPPSSACCCLPDASPAAAPLYFLSYRLQRRRPRLMTSLDRLRLAF